MDPAEATVALAEGDNTAELIADSGVATPVLAISGVAVDAMGVTLTIEQVLNPQHVQAYDANAGQGKDWPIFNEVPYHIGCVPERTGCTATDAEIIAPPFVLAGVFGTQRIEFDGASSIEVALIANGHLVPGVPPTYAESNGVLPVDPRQRGKPSTRTWFRICAPGSTDVGCDVNADGDAWFGAGAADPPRPGDCVDYIDTIFPGAIDPAGAWNLGPTSADTGDTGMTGPRDKNCDGVPNPAWYNPVPKGAP